MGRIGMLAPVLAALAAACASAGAGDGATSAQSIPPAGKLPFTIGSETTVITKPVGPDGLPDYLAALNAEYSKGVTPDSNAFLLLARAFGPTFFDEKLLPSYCRALGIERFEFLDDCWAPLPDAKPFELAQQAACERPWKPDEHPKLYGWLRRNEDALKLIVAASDRPRYYMPLVCSPTSKAPFRVSGALIRSVAKCQAAARALAARANLRLSGGDAAGAWADVRAIYRLGNVLTDGSTLIEQLVAMAVSRTGDDALLALVRSGAVSKEYLRTILRELPACRAPRTVWRPMDRGDRYVVLDVVVRIAREPGLLDHFLAARDRPKEERARMVKWLRDHRAAVDWDAMLRRCNRWYDASVWHMKPEDMRKGEAPQFDFEKEPGRAEAEGLYAPGDAEWDELWRVVKRRAGDETPETRYVGSVLLGRLYPRVGRAAVIARRAAMWRELVRVAVALALHKADRGHYPAKLASLQPGFLKTLPPDRFGDGLPRYERTKNGYLLWSVGLNGEDDGGQHYRDEGGDPEDDDLVLRMP